MKAQNYNNYRKFYTPHHFIYLPLLAVLQVIGIVQIFRDGNHQLTWILFSVLIFLLIYLSLMLRQHYALGNQNRIVRLEFKQRYFEMYNKRSDEVAEKLNFDQISALRFAYDDEFKTLLEKALSQNISGDEIKKSITNWRADHHRI